MSKIRLLAAIIAVAAMLLSCARDKENDNNADPIRINLILEGARAETKSVDNNPVDEDNVINDLIVFLVRSDNTFDAGPFYFSAAQLTEGNKVPTMTGTTLATSVIVITNTGPLSTGAFRSVANLAGLDAIVAALDKNPNTSSQCVSENVWMSGNALLSAAEGSGGTATKTATVDLEYLPAKIYVKLTNDMTNFDSGNVILDGVAIINGGAWTRFTTNNGNYKPAESQIPSDDAFFYNGIAVDPDSYTDNPGAGNYVVNSIYEWSPDTFFPMTPTTPIPAVANQDATEGFYVFPAITNNHTYLTVYGRYDPSQGASALTDPNYFWSFAFGGSDGLTSAVASGEKYVISLSLNGNANTGGGGSTDITETFDNASVDITVNTAVWTPHLIDKVIQ